MSSTVISVEGLGKKYRLGAASQPYRTMREAITDMARFPLTTASRLRRRGSPANGNGNGGGGKRPEFWALRDVGFEVKRGEVLGIIGRNGAGKSTLLKLLSHITEPTEGRIRIKGQVSSLLEVGTGFHPELTGRENVMLNGAILGMPRADIMHKFDEIVAFAEVERFIDTQVKHYSSGMYLRLAFAVAAHLEPEILIVDEVLAVGDASFQKKCIGKMGDVAGEGRTVLFVSHNMAAVTSLCNRALFLVNGRIVDNGPTEKIVSTYISLGQNTSGEVIWPDPISAPGNEVIRLHAVRILVEGEVTSDVDIQKDVEVQIEFWNMKPGADVSSSIHLLDQMGTAVLASANWSSASLCDDGWYGRPHPVGLYWTSCILPGNFLNDGLYKISAFVLTNATQIEARAHEAVSFTVHETGAMRKEYTGDWLGVVRPRLAWQTELAHASDGVLREAT